MGVTYWQLGQQARALEITQNGTSLVEMAVEDGILGKSSLAVPYGNLASMFEQMGETTNAGKYANKVFVLVYNLYDTADLYRRFPAAEGRLYFVGGFAATYLRRGNIVLIPVRLGVGYRAGVNIGYMKFTQKSSWLPF